MNKVYILILFFYLFIISSKLLIQILGGVNNE